VEAYSWSAGNNEIDFIMIYAMLIKILEISAAVELTKPARWQVWKRMTGIVE
jgi:hypothetical protein